MENNNKPKLAILFWFYTDVAVCVNRLHLLKKHNPESKIYGLYGGPSDGKTLFQETLSELLDDFYVIEEQDSFRKRIHGDLYLLEWYQERGRLFDRDSIVIAQRDLLAFESFDTIFDGIQKDEIFLPYYSLVDDTVEEKWYWTSKTGLAETNDTDPLKPHLRNNYLAFKAYVKNEYAFDDLLPRTIFTFAVLPTIFFEKYVQVTNIELGFLEYKIATYADIFGLRRFEKDFGERGERPINALKKEISLTYIHNQLKDPQGWRLFHPYFHVFG